MPRTPCNDRTRRRPGEHGVPPGPTTGRESHELHIWVASAKDMFPGLSRHIRMRGDLPRSVREEPACRALADILSDDELDRLEQFRAPKAALLFLAAHAMTRLVLERYDPGSLSRKTALPRHPLGKPFLGQTASGRPLFFNISHSWPLAAVAVTRTAECGIDVEMTDPRLPWRELCDTALHPRERRAVLSSPAPALAFLRHWTLKEAAAKALGLGLHWDFREFAVQERNGLTVCGGEAGKTLSLRSMPCSRLDASLSGFLAVGCLVAPEEMPSISIRKFREADGDAAEKHTGEGP